jgi:hypothetical protein
LWAQGAGTQSLQQVNGARLAVSGGAMARLAFTLLAGIAAVASRLGMGPDRRRGLGGRSGRWLRVVARLEGFVLVFDGFEQMLPAPQAKFNRHVFSPRCVTRDQTLANSPRFVMLGCAPARVRHSTACRLDITAWAEDWAQPLCSVFASVFWIQTGPSTCDASVVFQA